MTRQCGLARNNVAAVQYLNSCPAVIEFCTISANWLEFVYDDQIEVYAVPDHLIWFDEGNAPDEALSALNTYHNG